MYLVTLPPIFHSVGFWSAESRFHVIVSGMKCNDEVTDHEKIIASFQGQMFFSSTGTKLNKLNTNQEMDLFQRMC